MSTMKHLRLSIDFHVAIADTPPPDTQNPPDAEYDGRQARLLEAVKAHPAVLQCWMSDLIASKMAQKPFGYWIDMIAGGDTPLVELLEPAIETLSDDDRDFFAEADRIDMFEECIDLFQASFTITEGSPQIAEQERQS